MGKSTLVLDVKPAGQDVDLDALEKKLREEIKVPGFMWSEKSERVPLFFGMSAIRIGGVIDDDVDLEGIKEEIESWEDLVASTEIQAFQKI